MVLIRSITKISVSFAKNRWDIVSNVLVALTIEKPKNYPKIAVASNIRLKASMTIPKRSGNSEFP